MMAFYVLLIGIILVWFVVRTVRQGEALRRLQEQRAAQQMRSPRPAVAATDTITCPRCGVYLPADRPTACQRSDCPYPRAA
jgi:hypothetical protein